MKLKNSMIGFLLFITLIFGGCASYSPALVRLDKFGPNTVKHKEGDLCIYIEEYATNKKCEIAFDADLYDQGVLPLLFMVENNSQKLYEVKVTDIIVQDSDKLLKALTPEEAASKVKRRAVGRAIGWSLIVPIIAIPAAAIASANHTSKVNKQIVHDFTAKSFQEGIVMPNKILSGFLFFEIDTDQDQLLSDMNLEITARNIDTEEIITIVLPLPKAMLGEENLAISQKDKCNEYDPFTGQSISKNHLMEAE